MFFSMDMFSIFIAIIHLYWLTAWIVIHTMWYDIDSSCMDRTEVSPSWINYVQQL